MLECTHTGQTINPSDLLFDRPVEATLSENLDVLPVRFLSTYQKQLAAFGDVFEMDDCDGRMFAWAKENIFSWGGGRGVAYDIHDADDVRIMRSKSASFWDVHMKFTDAYDVPIGDAFMPLSIRMAQGWFCNGGRYDLSFNATTSQRDRQIIVALAAIKAVRDQTRNKDGDVTGSWCHSFFVLMWAGPPILLCWCCVYACGGTSRRRARTRQSISTGSAYVRERRRSSLASQGDKGNGSAAEVTMVVQGTPTPAPGSVRPAPVVIASQL